MWDVTDHAIMIKLPKGLLYCRTKKNSIKEEDGWKRKQKQHLISSLVKNTLHRNYKPKAFGAAYQKCIRHFSVTLPFPCSEVTTNCWKYQQSKK